MYAVPSKDCSTKWNNTYPSLLALSLFSRNAYFLTVGANLPPRIIPNFSLLIQPLNFIFYKILSALNIMITVDSLFLPEAALLFIYLLLKPLLSKLPTPLSADKKKIRVQLKDCALVTLSLWPFSSKLRWIYTVSVFRTFSSVFLRFCFSLKKYALFHPHFYKSIYALSRLLYIDKNFAQKFCVWTIRAIFRNKAVALYKKIFSENFCPVCKCLVRANMDTWKCGWKSAYFDKEKQNRKKTDKNVRKTDTV